MFDDLCQYRCVKTLLSEIDTCWKHYSWETLKGTSTYDFSVSDVVDVGLSVVQRSREKYILSGRLKTTLATHCDRCGDGVELPVDALFTYVLQIGEEPLRATEYQCSDEDCETLYLDAAAIDCEALVREQLSLALPVQNLCDKSCKGLCVRCGVNLNKEKCQCGEENEDSPFAILKTLKNNN